jgi:pyruvate/2-oxoglutarate dehydrogenase complex dihydrolipoamide acyltransferase (E2) component
MGMRNRPPETLLSMADTVLPLLVAQVNVNDDAVRVVSWAVDRGANVRVGDAICMVETSKATVEIVAEHAGVIVPVVAVDSTIAVGAPLAFVGPTLAAVDASLAASSKADAGAHGDDGVKATPRAAALARKLGVDLAAVFAAGVRGTIKEGDVEAFAAQGASRSELAAARPARPTAGATIPASLEPLLLPPANLSRHELAVIENLSHSKDNLILVSLDFDLPLERINRALAAKQEGGTVVWVQHVLIAAVARALQKYPRLMSLRDGAAVRTYRSTDIGFVVRSPDGRLFTPVIRDAARLSLAEVAKACTMAAVRVMRGRVTDEELHGACFTMSHIGEAGVSRFVAMPNRHQSAILAVAGERQGPAGPTVTLTVTYDHALCDGVYVAGFLKTVAAAATEVIA